MFRFHGHLQQDSLQYLHPLVLISACSSVIPRFTEILGLLGWLNVHWINITSSWREKMKGRSIKGRDGLKWAWNKRETNKKETSAKITIRNLDSLSWFLSFSPSSLSLHPLFLFILPLLLMNKNKKRLAKKLDMDWETWDREKMSFPSSKRDTVCSLKCWGGFRSCLRSSQDFWSAS